MALKPSTQPEYWATDAVYTTGPFIGQPQKVVPPAAFAAEGHRPGALFPTPAEYENSQQYNLTGLARWVFLGSSAGAADAHIVEADSVGRSQLQGLTLTDAVDETVLNVTGINTLASAVFVTATSGGGAIQADIGASSGFGFLVQTGAGATCRGVDVNMVSTPAGGRGFVVTADALTAGIGLEVVHSGSGTGIDVDVSAGTGGGVVVDGNATTTAMVVTGGAGQAAIAGVSGNNAIAAVGGAGTGTAIGVTGDGGAGSSAAHGVRGTGVHADANGVYGRTSVSASATAAGVYGEARGAGTNGVWGEGGTVGRGLIASADTTTPAYSALRIIPQDADPTSAVSDGEVIWHSSHKQLRTCIAGEGYRSVLAMGPGSAMMVSEALAPNTVYTTAVGYGTMLTVLCDAAAGTGVYGSALGAEVLIVLNLDVRNTSVGAGGIYHLNVRLTDNTNTATIAEWNGAGTAANDGFGLDDLRTDWQRAVAVGVRYAFPADGDLEVLVEVSHTGAVLEVRDAVCTITGTYR